MWSFKREGLWISPIPRRAYPGMLSMFPKWVLRIDICLNWVAFNAFSSLNRQVLPTPRTLHIYTCFLPPPQISIEKTSFKRIQNVNIYPEKILKLNIFKDFSENFLEKKSFPVRSIFFEYPSLFFQKKKKNKQKKLDPLLSLIHWKQTIFIICFPPLHHITIILILKSAPRHL